MKGVDLASSREVSLMECTIAGTTHIDGIVAKTATVFEGTILTLVRDPKNEYDSDAIAVQTDAGERIGWVPQRRTRSCHGSWMPES